MPSSSARELMDRYPEVFRLRNAGIGAFRGIECDDGWLPILDKMCADLSGLTEVPAVFQIKEKFAELRCYFSGVASDGAYVIVGEAVAEAAKTCEVCGAPGSAVNVQGVYKTVCEEHRLALEKRLSSRYNR